MLTYIDIGGPHGGAHRFCHQAGEACTKVRRATELIAEVIAEPDAQDLGEVTNPCYEDDGVCTKHKRALVGLSEVVNGML